MSNVASVLKEEISRISRKEIRRETSSLKKSSTTHRSEIAALKRRVLELERQGLRERVVKTREAAPASFAIGEFALVVEPVPGAADPAAAVGEPIVAHGPLVQLRTRRTAPAGDRAGRVPPKLELCRACSRYVHAHEVACPHCGADLAEAAAAHAETVQRRRALIERLERALAI
jgi:hypothetical protein